MELYRRNEPLRPMLLLSCVLALTPFTAVWAGRPAARLGDTHVCPRVTALGVPHVGGRVSTSATTVLIGSVPAARIGDKASCNGPWATIATGEPTVLIQNSPAARTGDTTNHGGRIVSGHPTVLIGDGSESELAAAIEELERLSSLRGTAAVAGLERFLADLRSREDEPFPAAAADALTRAAEALLETARRTGSDGPEAPASGSP